MDITFTGTAPFTYVYSDGSNNFGPFVTSNNPETVVVSPTVSTTYTLVSMSDGTGPGTVSGSFAVTVDLAPPVGSITNAGFVVPSTGCNGDLIPVSCNLVPGATGYTWTTPPGTLVNGAVSPVTTAINSATLTLGPVPPGQSSYEVCVYASNACGVTNARCKKIRGTVSTPGPITGNTIACAGTSANYSISAVNAASTYNWTTTGGIVINSGNGTLTVNVTFPVGFTTGNICVNAALACGATSSDRCITVVSGPGSLGVMTGTFVNCPGATGIAFLVPSNAAITTYDWTVPANSTIASGQGTNAITVDFGPGFNGGQICVTGTSTCGTLTAPRCKTISAGIPARPGNIIGQANGVCGDTITYSVVPVAGATSYNWTVPATATLLSGQGTNSIDLAFPPGFTGGQICVTASNGCGTSQSRCINTDGIPSDPAAISGPAVICDSGIGVVYSVLPVDGATSYNWTVPVDATITNGQGTNSITVDWGTTSGLVTVQASNACGISGTETLNVLYSITPIAPGPITGPEFVCAPITGLVYYINAVPGAQSYLWYFDGNPGGATFASVTNDTIVTIDFAVSANSVYKLRVIALNSICGDSPYSGKQLRQHISVPHLSGADFVCAGDSSVYSVPAPVVGVASYSWTAPAGATIDGNPSPFVTTNLSVTIAFPGGFISGDVCVAGVDPCGNSTADRCMLVRSIPAKPGKVFGPAVICGTSTNVMYYTNPIPGATGYTWIMPSGATVASGQGNDTVFVDFSGFTGGDICVTADNTCGSSPQECKDLFDDVPAMASNIIGPITGLCGGTFNYSVNNAAGITFNWTAPAGALITSGQGTNAVTVDFSGTTFPSVSNQYLTLCVNTENSCTTSADRCVNIKGITSDPGTINGPASVCAHQTGVAYDVAAVTGATSYIWTVPTDAIIASGAGTNSITVDFGAVAGAVTVRAENSCGISGTRSLGVAMPCRIADGTSIALQAYPNPVSDLLHLTFTLEQQGMVDILVIDLSGKVLNTLNYGSVKGFNNTDLDVSGLASGIYMVQIRNSSGILANFRIAVE